MERVNQYKMEIDSNNERIQELEAKREELITVFEKKYPDPRKVYNKATTAFNWTLMGVTFVVLLAFSNIVTTGILFDALLGLAFGGIAFAGGISLTADIKNKRTLKNFKNSVEMAEIDSISSEIENLNTKNNELTQKIMDVISEEEEKEMSKSIRIATSNPEYLKEHPEAKKINITTKRK